MMLPNRLHIMWKDFVQTNARITTQLQDSHQLIRPENYNDSTPSSNIVIMMVMHYGQKNNKTENTMHSNDVPYVLIV